MINPFGLAFPESIMKVDHDMLADLRELATTAHRLVQKHWLDMAEVEKTTAGNLEDIRLRLLYSDFLFY